jgi:Protein of unknown function (DUF2958)
MSKKNKEKTAENGATRRRVASDPLPRAARSAVAHAYAEYERACDAGKVTGSRNPIWTGQMAQVAPSAEAVTDEPDPMALYRYFSPVGSAEWYVVATDALPSGDVILYGYADLGDDQGEFGSFALSELRSVRLPFDLRIELDRYFPPRRISELLAARGRR